MAIMVPLRKYPYVYVDELVRIQPKRKLPKGQTPYACRMTADNIAVLRAFAYRASITRPMKLEPVPHYELTESMRRRVLEYGAEFIPAEVQALAREMGIQIKRYYEVWWHDDSTVLPYGI